MIGLDFTNNEIRMVQLSSHGKSAVLERYAVGAIPAGVFQGGRVVETARFADVIKELYRTHKFTSKKCVLGISGKYGVTRLITLPKMSAAQTRDAIQLQLNQYVPFPPGDTLFDYKVLREVKEEEQLSQEILLVATRRSTMAPIMSALKKAGLNPVGIKITTLTAFNLFEAQYFDQDQAIGFVDVRDVVTDISFVSENYFRLSRSVEFGSALVTDKIRQKIGGTNEDVEEYLALNKIDLLQDSYKPPVSVTDEPADEESDDISPLERQQRRTGTTGEDSKEKGVRDSVLRILGAFVNELMRSIRFFESQQKRRSRVGKVVLFGNINYLSSFASYISEQTGLDTFVVEKTPESVEMGLSGIDLQIYEGNESKAVVAISLAYDGVRSRKVELNLVPRETVVRKKAFSFVKYAIAGFVILVALMANWYISKDRVAQDIKKDVQKWDNKINQITPYYNETEKIKSDVNAEAPKVEGVLTLVKKQIAWVPILEELGKIQLQSTWIDEFSMDSNEGSVEFHGTAYKTSNLQRFYAILFYSNIFEIEDIGISRGGNNTGGGAGDQGAIGGSGSSSGAMSAPGPSIPGIQSAGRRLGLTPTGNSGTAPMSKIGDIKPMYGLPELPRGPREIENFWQGRNIILPVLWEFDLELVISAQALDTSSAAFEGLDKLSV